MNDAWNHWPLINIKSRRQPGTVGLTIPLGDVGPDNLDAIIKKALGQWCDVYIAWVGEFFSVIERIEPITDSDERQMVEEIGGDWRHLYGQDFEVITPEAWGLAVLPEDWDAWLESIHAEATASAVEHFSHEKSPSKMFVDDQSYSAAFDAAVLFSASQMDFAGIKANRESVIEWAMRDFRQILGAHPLPGVLNS